VYDRGIDEGVVAEMDPNVTGTTTALYPLQDELGNVTHLTDQSGAVVERYQYEGYGKFRIFDATNSPRSASAFGWNRLFQGREYIGLVDAYDFRARTLWPELGRFGQEDPAGFIDSPNLYQALKGAWTANTDPLGQWTYTWGPTVFGGAGVGVGFYAAWAVDGHGNFGLVWSPQTGGFSGMGGSAGVQLGWTQLDTICDLKGLTVEVGGSGGAPLSGGLDLIVYPYERSPIKGLAITWGTGTTLPDVEFHAQVSDTNLLFATSFFRDLAEWWLLSAQVPGVAAWPSRPKGEKCACRR
jgi:RHS repeat-associated protein